jgi:hypothetical protein
MKIPRLSSMTATDVSAFAPNPNPDPEQEQDYPQQQRCVWEPSEFIKPPTREQLMAGR